MFTSYSGASNIDSLLKILDKTILENETYEIKKKSEIDTLILALKDAKGDDTLSFKLHNQLYEAYNSYICDSAQHYIQLNINLAQHAQRQDWLNASYIQMAAILASSSLFQEAKEMMQRVDRTYLTKELWIEYYSVYETIYLYQAEYTIDDLEYSSAYIKKRELYRDSVLNLADKNSFLYFSSKGSQYLDSGYIEEAKILLFKALETSKPGTRGYAIATAILAAMYDKEGDVQKNQEYLIRSAISDIQAVVKENNSIRTLASLMFEQGEIDRANRYVKESMQNANTFNARLRNLQTSKMLPIIDNAYNTQLKEQQQKLKRLLICAVSLSIGLIIAIILVIIQLRKLAAARRALQIANDDLTNLISELNTKNQLIHQKNSELTEANSIKEEYIGRFLSQCSAYIDTLDNFRRSLNKLLTNNKTDELRKRLNSKQIVDEQADAVYQNCDSAFLKIYPNFVSEFNALLLPEHQILPKHSEMLTTALRIFALSRLGFTDSGKIAAMLRYSITTIYTYRSKTKARAISPTSFEEEIMQIAAL